MYIIYLKEKTCELSGKSFHQLQDILPYWGLKLTDEYQVIGRFHNRRLNLLLQDHELFEEINHVLKHTGITLSSKSDISYDFVIDAHDKEDITVFATKMTYHLKMLNKDNSFNLQKAIHNKLWLPVRVPPIHISLPNHLDKKKQAEHTAYLLIQYLSQQDLQNISYISLTDFQYLNENVLLPLNPKLSALQQFTKKSYRSWPEPPKIMTQKEANQSIMDHQPTLSQPLIDHSVNGTEINHQPSIGPASRQPVIKKPINPFKNSISKKDSPINPFK